jgi:hypothetical protein
MNRSYSHVESEIANGHACFARVTKREEGAKCTGFALIEYTPHRIDGVLDEHP